MSTSLLDQPRVGRSAEGGITIRTTLVIDAISSLVLGLLAIFARPQLVGWLGLSNQVLFVAGIILLAAAILVFVTAAVAWQPGPLLGIVTAGNGAWVALSIGWIIVQAGSLTALGVVVIAAQAVVVTLYVVRYLIALRQPFS